MKKIVLVVLLAGCLSLMLVGAAAAVPYDPTFTYPGREVAHWELNAAGTWDGFDAGDLDALARCFATGEFDEDCNARNWEIPVDIHASVAQWVDIYIDGTDWHWFVLKPGTYAADCIAYTIKSNQEIKVDFDDFNNLVGDKSLTPISIWYNDGDFADPPLPGAANGWLTPAQLNASSFTFPDTTLFHTQGVHSKLWCMIEVVPCNSACEYEDYATIKLELLCQKPWVKDDGDWGGIVL